MAGRRNVQVVWLAGLPAATPACLAGWQTPQPAHRDGWLPGRPASHRGCVAVQRAVRPEWLHVRRPRCLPGDAGGPAGKNDRARFRPARLAGEADGKPDESPGPSLAESCDDAISKLN